MNFENPRPGVLLGERELNLAVESARSEKRRVEDVDPVRRRDDLDPLVRAKAVELVEEFKHRPLDLAVTGLVRIEPLRADGVELVNEDDGGRLLLGELERVPDELGAVSDKHLEGTESVRERGKREESTHLDKRRASELEVAGVGLEQGHVSWGLCGRQHRRAHT